MASIADIFFSALLDDSKLQVDAVKAGDKAGQTLGQRLAGGLATKMHAGLGVVAGAAGIAVHGMLQLDEAVAQYTADTGASADEAKRAGVAINAMSSRNIQGVAEIGATLASVHTNLGLTGDAAEQTTEKFLKFANVTKRNAAEEVVSFDHILGAWGLTADKSDGIMDQLIASHQKFGGSVAADEDALTRLAPAMKALNFSLDDSIGLLNLFKSRGLDAADTTKAFNSAVLKLPKGTSLKDFLTSLANIPDATKRAEVAVKVFGTKGGIALSNALGPGVGALKDFEISAKDAAGATDRASDAIDSAFGTQIQLKLKAISSWLTSIGQQFGPLITGFAGLGSLAGALGLDEFVTVFAKKMGQAGKEGGAALIDAAQTWTGAAGTIIGNTIAQPIIDALDPEKKSLLGKLSAKAIAGGAKVGAVWGSAMAAGTRLAAVIGGVLTALPGAGIVRSAALASAIKIGTLSGTAMGGAMALGLKLGFVVGLAAIAPDLAKSAQDLGQQFHNNFLKGTFLDDIGKSWRDFRRDAPWPLGQKDAPDWAHLGNDTSDGVKTVFSAADTAAALAAQRAGEHAGSEMSDSIVSSLVAAGIPEDIAKTLADGAGTVGAGADAGIVQPVKQSIADMVKNAKHEAAKLPSELAGAIEAGRSDWTSSLSGLRSDAATELARTADIAKTKAELASKKLADGLASKDPKIRATWLQQEKDWRAHLAQLVTDTSQPMSRIEEITSIKAELTSKEMLAGLSSKDATIRARWSALHESLEARLRTLQGTVSTISDKTASYLADAIKRNKGNVAAQAILTKIAVQNALGTLPSSAYGWGYATEKQLAAGMKAGEPLVLTVARHTAGILSNNLRQRSPAKEGPLSKDGGTHGWGRKAAELLAAGMLARTRAVEAAAGRLAGAAIPAMRTPGIDSPEYRTAGLARAATVASEHATAGLAHAAAGGDTFVTNLHMPAPPTRNPLEAIERAGFYQRSGLLNPRLRPAGA